MLEAPEQKYAPEFVAPRRTSAAPNRKLRRDFSDDFSDELLDEEDVPVTRRRSGVRLKFRGGLPRTKWGRIAAGSVAVVFLGLGVAALLLARSALMHDQRFVVQSSSAIEFEGNAHLTREQMLNVFDADVERNIFYVPLAQRKAELEQLPWVAHATVMRLLPNRLRVLIVERTPVAFVRSGSHIGLVDANGVLLDMPPGAQGDAHYSFPVVTGIVASDPLSTRAARMKIFERFTSDLDGGGDRVSQGLSEVDLSNPEDVKALIPTDSSDVLVHFGEGNFLERYKKFEEHLPEWQTQYPKLSSVDMRYDSQAVLEMQPGSADAAGDWGAGGSARAGGSAPAAAEAVPAAVKTAAAAPVVAHPVAKAPVHAPVLAHAVVKAPVHAPAKIPVHAGAHAPAHVPVKRATKWHPVAKHVVGGKARAGATAPVHVQALSEVAYAVSAKKGGIKASPHTAKAHAAVRRPAGKATKNHSSRAVQP